MQIKISDPNKKYIFEKRIGILSSLGSYKDDFICDRNEIIFNDNSKVENGNKIITYGNFKKYLNILSGVSEIIWENILYIDNFDYTWKGVAISSNEYYGSNTKENIIVDLIKKSKLDLDNITYIDFINYRYFIGLSDKKDLAKLKLLDNDNNLIYLVIDNDITEVIDFIRGF